MLNYILEVNLCWLGFYLLYSLLLSRETFFEYNRWYLLGGLIGGILIPLVEYPIIIEQIVEQPALTALDLEMLAEVNITAAVKEGSSKQLLSTIFFGIYFLGAGLLLLRFIFGLSRIAYLYRKGIRVARPGYALIKTPTVHPPFSFFHWLFQSRQLELTTADEEKIIAHEIEHIRQWHSIDVLLLEIISILLWFSPLVWLYRRSLRMIHEYQADEAVLQTTQRKTYGHLLIRQSMSGLPIAIANHFIHSQLKKRLTMMTKKKSTQRSLMKYTFIIPLFALFLMAFAPTKVYKTVPGPDFATTVNDPGPDLGKIKAKLSAILSKRAYAKSNIDKDITSTFAMAYEKFLKSYPDHQKEITAIATAVADHHGMDIKTEGGLPVSYSFRQPFKANTWIGKAPKEKPVNTIDQVLEKDLSRTDKVVLYLLDKKPISKEQLQRVAPESIEKINVLKGEKAFQKYGDKGKDGVVEVYTHEYIKKIQKELGRKKEGYKEAKARDFDLVEEEINKLQKEENISAIEERKTPKGNSFELKGDAVKDVKPKIQIRGTKNKANQPLFVVDGKVLDQGSPLNDLDPNDIESIHVLKGQAALDKYDEKGRNGVVEITTKRHKEESETIVDEMPRFTGCNDMETATQKNACSKKKLMEFVMANMLYPKAAKEKGLEGKVIVSFTIKKNGQVAKASVASGSEESSFREEALRVVNLMPNWIPGTKDGKAVDVEMKLPFNFSLGKKEKPHIHKETEEMPLFPGVEANDRSPKERKMISDKKMLEFIYKNIKYPKSAKEDGIEGPVVVSMVISKEGDLKDPKIVQEPSPELGQEVLRVIRAMPAPWTPGKNKGQAVDMEIKIPVRFRVESPKPAEQPKLAPLPTPEMDLQLQSFKLTPNPNSGDMRVSFQAESSPVWIRIHDVKGQEVYKEYLPDFAGSYEKNIRLEKVAKGPHILTITQDKKRFSTKFVTQ